MTRLIMKCIVLLGAVQIVLASTSMLRNTSWVYSEYSESSGILLQFDDEVVHAWFRCISAVGDYHINGSTGLQMQLHTFDTLCEHDDPNLTLYDTEYASMIEMLNAVGSFSSTFSDSELCLFTGSNDTMCFRMSLGGIPNEALSGKWYSLRSASTLQFFDNGDVAWYDGCNHGWGHFKINNELLSLYDIGGSLRACENANRIFELPETGAFSISGDTLSIGEGNNSYHYTRTEVPLRIGADVPGKTHWQPGMISSGEMMFCDIKGRMIKSGAALHKPPVYSGIEIQRQWNGVRAVVFIHK